MGGHVYNGVNVGLIRSELALTCADVEAGTTYERHSSEIPEDNKETPLLVEHVPGLRDALLTLDAGVEVKPGSQAHECHVLPRDEPCATQTLNGKLTGVT